MRTLIVMAAVALMAGCGSTGLTPAEMQFLQAQAEQQTLKIDCPAGCSVSYKDPRDKVQIPHRTNGWDAAIAVAGSAERLVGGAIVPYAFVELGKSGFKALKGNGETHTTVTTTNTSIGDYSGDNSGRVGDYSGDGSGTTTRVGDYSGHSSGRVGDYSGGQSGNGGILGDYAGQQSGTSGTINSDIPGRVSSPNDGRFDSPDDYSSRDSSSRDNRVIGGAPE